MLGFAELGLRPAPHPLAESNGRFVGSKKCESCHEKSYDIWKKSGHAHAYETLAEARSAAELRSRVRQLPRRRLAPDQVLPVPGRFRERQEDAAPDQRRLRRLPRAGREALRRRELGNDEELQKKYRKAVRHHEGAVEERAMHDVPRHRQQPRLRFRQVLAVDRASRERAAMKRVLLCAAIAAFAAAGWAQEPLAPRAAADPRRTPAVEIFQRYKDSVVYLTGPMVGPREPAVEEFFVLPRKREVTSLGSGFVVHESGYILANAHAVEKPFFHEVTLSNGKKLPAELLAVVREHDLALLKVEAGRPLTAVKLARDGDLLIGEPVIVIGNPQGLRLTCTTGVVSAVGRATRPSGLPGVILHGMIQTDAAINPGSSGGPWFNAARRGDRQSPPPKSGTPRTSPSASPSRRSDIPCRRCSTWNANRESSPACRCSRTSRAG